MRMLANPLLSMNCFAISEIYSALPQSEEEAKQSQKDFL